MEQLGERNRNNQGPYSPNDSADAVLMGENQWQWFQEQMSKQVDVKIIGTTIQLLADFTGWETWLNFPRERERFFDLMRQYQHSSTVLISGDVHWCELSKMQVPGLASPLMELTSSGLTEIWEKISPNKHRVSDAYAVQNFGLVEIDWSSENPLLTLLVKGVEGNTLIYYQVG